MLLVFGPVKSRYYLNFLCILFPFSPDQWPFYEQYLESVFHLVDSDYTPPPSSTNDTVDECKDKTMQHVDGIKEATENGLDADITDEQNKDKKESKDSENKTEEESKDSEKKTEEDSKDSEKKETETTADYTVEMAYSFIKKQIDELEGSRSIRGPYLAQLEFLKILIERKQGEEKSIEIGKCFSFFLL